jgi:Subtilase family
MPCPPAKEEHLVRSSTWPAGLAAAALTVSGLAVGTGAAAQAAANGQAHRHATHSPDSATPDYRPACAAARPGRMSCLALVRIVRPGAQARRGADLMHRAGARLAGHAAPTADGYGPASLQSAYQLPSATAGRGETVAVVDAFDDPSAASDLAAYRAAWGLPACGADCFTKVNQEGKASPLPRTARLSGWPTEESLDIDMVSAICPNCHILLVEASNARAASLGAAVNTAVSMGAKYVSNSYGAPETAADLALDSKYYRHPGVAVTASAGDSGYGLSYPAASQYVTSVGGTSLRPAAGSRGWAERAWGKTGHGAGTGAGCSAVDAKPAWQADTGCTMRTDNDVAADANPNTGVAVYDSYDQHGWLEAGGTSAAAPIIASVFALAGPPAAGSYPSSYPYLHASSLFDVTSGADGSCAGSYRCTAKAGYDGPTGLGSPDGTAAFAASAPAAGCPAGQLLRDPGFERRKILPWTARHTVLTKASRQLPAHSGAQLAWLDGYGVTHTDTLAQTVTIPAGCRHATFSFWLATATDAASGPAADTLTLRVLGSGGTVLGTLARYTNSGAAAGYRRHSFSLARYAGQRITLKFTGTETLVGHVTSFLEDDNALHVS